jgi:hypothetical protein
MWVKDSKRPTMPVNALPPKTTTIKGVEFSAGDSNAISYMAEAEGGPVTQAVAAVHLGQSPTNSSRFGVRLTGADVYVQANATAAPTLVGRYKLDPSQEEGLADPGDNPTGMEISEPFNVPQVAKDEQGVFTLVTSFDVTAGLGSKQIVGKGSVTSDPLSLDAD